MTDPRVSVAEGVLACVFVTVLCLLALGWVLWLPPPDRSVLSRPSRPTDDAIAAHNRAVEQETLAVTMLRCGWCVTGQPVFARPSQLIAHVRVVHGEVLAASVARRMADRWHRESGIE